MKKILFSFMIALFALTGFASVVSAEEETYTYIDFAGALTEIGNTTVPTTIIVKENTTGVNYVVNITSLTVLGQKRDQYTRLEDWIPGDQIRIRGNQNDNTGVVEANVAANLSIVTKTSKGINGWITEINTSTNTIKVQWAGRIYELAIDSSTHIVVAGKNPAAISDLQINDRIRGRVLKNLISGKYKAKIIILLRRGEDLYLKSRTWAGKVELQTMAGYEAPTTITVKLLDNSNLNPEDKNNLMGAVGDIKTINILPETKFVRRFLGTTNLYEFIPGDELFIVVKVNDDGTSDGKVLKNNDIWNTSTKGFPSTIKEVNVSGGYITAEWYGTDYKVVVDADTHIVRYDKNPASLSDLLVGDQVKVRGTAREDTKTVNAEEIVVR